MDYDKWLEDSRNEHEMRLSNEEMERQLEARETYTETYYFDDYREERNGEDD